jgi:phosphatidylinositol alpha-1,6-mannosyltransferase
MTAEVDIVLSYDCPPRIGGAHAWLYESYRRWPGPVSWLAATPAPSEPEATAERLFDAGDHGALTLVRKASPTGDLSILSAGCWRAFRQHLRAIGEIRGGRPARLHALRAFPEGIAGWVARKLAPGSTRLVTYAHGEEILVAGTSRQLRWIARRVYQDSDLVIANSENTRRMVLALSPRARVIIIHPGVDAASFRLPPDQIAATRARWGWDRETPVLATVARMEPRKNQAMVIRAVARLGSRGIRVAYLCAGDGEERLRLIDLARELGVEDRVRFPGAVDDQLKKLIFASADIHIMPSVQAGAMIEGFGIVFLEAAAAGIPSVGGASGGQREAVRDGVTGFTVDGNDLEAVTAAIARLAGEADLRQRMGRQARLFAQDQDWNNVVSRTLAAVRDLA